MKSTPHGPPSAGPRAFPPELRPALRRREPAALEALFEALFDPVYAFVRRLVGDDHAAEDVTQEVFAEVHRQLDTYDPGRDPRPWILGIAANRARQHWRRRSARPDDPQADMNWESVQQELSTPLPGPLGELAREESRERVQRALGELPPGLRAAVLLRTWEGLAFEQIGVALELSAAAVRQRYSRALARLRAVLASPEAGAREGRL